jgi:hypothetical protein
VAACLLVRDCRRVHRRPIAPADYHWLMAKEKSKSESSAPLRGEMPEVVAASGNTATWCRFLPKWPHFSLPPTLKLPLVTAMLGLGLPGREYRRCRCGPYAGASVGTGFCIPALSCGGRALRCQDDAATQPLAPFVGLWVLSDGKNRRQRVERAGLARD